MDPIAYDLNELTVTSNSILSFASVISFIAKKYQSSTNYNDIQFNLTSEYKMSRYFDLLLKSSLVAVLVLLLINFLIFNFYFEKVNSLQTIASFNQSNKKTLLELQEEVQKKEKRVENILSSSISMSSFYLDQIALGTPNSINFTEIKFQPLLKPVSEAKQIEIDQNIILITGISNNNQQFSKWIQDIENLYWVKQTQTLDFDFENENSSSFSLKVTIDEK